MAVIAVEPIMMGAAKLTLGTNDYEGHVSAATFTPTGNSPVSWKSLSPDFSFSRTPKASWTLDLEGAQDWETTDALSQYLLENEGEIVVATLEPVDGGAGYTADVQITPGAIGGAVDAVAVFTASLGSSKPTKVV